MVDNNFFLKYHYLAEAIMDGKTYNNFCFDSIGIDTPYEGDYVLAYILTSEYIHEQILEKAIREAFSLNKEEYINFDISMYFNDTDLKDELKHVLSKEDNTQTYFKSSAVNDSDQLVTDINYILKILLAYAQKHQNSGNIYSKVIIAYLPTIVFSFITQYTADLHKNINSTFILEKLIQPYVHIELKKSQDIRDKNETYKKARKAFNITILYNSILRSCKNYNLALSFVWFERHIGSYQYYFNSNEYIEVINQMCSSLNNIKNIRISNAVLLSNGIIKHMKEGSLTETIIEKTLDCFNIDLICESICTSIDSRINTTAFYKEILDTENNVELKKILNSSLKKGGQSERCCMVLINFMFYNNMRHRKNFIKNKSLFTFKCKMLTSNELKLSNVKFGTFVIDREYNDFEVISVPIGSNKFILCPKNNNILIKKLEFKEASIDIIGADNVTINGKSVGAKITDVCLDDITVDVDAAIYREKKESRHNQHLWIEKFHCINEKNSSDLACVMFGLNFYINWNVNKAPELQHNLEMLYQSGDILFSSEVLPPLKTSFDGDIANMDEYTYERPKVCSGSCNTTICKSSISEICVLPCNNDSDN